MNKINKEDYTKEKSRREADENLIIIKNEEIKMQQIREEHKQLEINRDILSNLLKSKSSHTINLTEFEKNTLIFVYTLKQTNKRYGRNYTNIGFLSDELNRQLSYFNSGLIHVYSQKLGLISLIK